MRKSIYPIRKKLRLEGYDYSSPGYYHIVLVTEKRKNYLGDFQSEQINLSPFGEILLIILEDFHDYFPNIDIVKYQIMPDHVHLLVNLKEIDTSDKTVSIPEFISKIKTFSVWKYKKNIATSENSVLPYKVWQRSYFDHILRCNE